jgi:hypothetical protein
MAKKSSNTAQIIIGTSHRFGGASSGRDLKFGFMFLL